MAVWIYAYGKNGRLNNSSVQQDLEILNSIPLNEIKILDSIKEIEDSYRSIREHYETNRRNIEKFYKSMPEKEYKEYLESVNLPFIPINKIIDRLIEDGEKRKAEQELQFNLVYEQFKQGKAKSNWKKGENGSYINSLNFPDVYEGLRVSFLNDLIQIDGPRSVFSVYSRFLEISTESREYYHSYFKKVFQAFNSDFILYAHEWSGLDDEEDEEFNLEKLKEQSDWKNTSSDSIHTMDAFYYEQLTNEN